MEDAAPSGRDTSFTQSPSISTSAPSTSASSRGSSNLPPWKSRDAIDTSFCPGATGRPRGPVAPKSWRSRRLSGLDARPQREGQGQVAPCKCANQGRELLDGVPAPGICGGDEQLGDALIME